MKWYQHIIKHHDVKCEDCGKTGKVWMLFRRILSRWVFWGLVIGNFEYWECRECFKKDMI